MKKATIFLVILFFAQLCSAQSNWIKVGFDYGPLRTYYAVPPESNSRTVYQNRLDIASNFAVSYMHLQTNKRFWEIGLTERIEQKIDQYRKLDTPIQPGSPDFEKVGSTSGYFVGLSVERGRNYKPECEANDEVYNAWFVSPFYSAYSFKDALRSDSLFAQQLKVAGITLGVSPRLQTYAGKRFLVELSMRLNVFNFSYSNNNVENPALSKRQQQSKSADFDLLSGIMFRVALGLRTDRIKKGLKDNAFPTLKT